MAVSIQETVFNHVANGVTVDFAYGCQILAASDLIVFVDDVVTTVGFAVNSVGNKAGGSVTFNAAPADGTKIRLERVIELKRTTDYQQSGDFLTRVVNPDFDRIWMALQQFETVLGVKPGSIARALMLGRSDTVGTGAYRALQNRIQDLGDPVNDQDATNKRWVLAQLAGFLTDGAGQFVLALLAGASGSSYLGHIASGAGSIGRTVQDKLREIVSVTDDGTDTAAFLSALAKAAEPFLPIGTYTPDLSAVDVSRLTGPGEILYRGNVISMGGALSAKKPTQKKLNELFFGFDTGTANDEIYSGARFGIQGIAYVVVNGVEKLFASQAVAGSTYDVAEKVRLIEFNLTDDGSVLNAVAYSQEINVGHGQDLSAEVIGADVYLWTQSPTTISGQGAGKGVSRIVWRGAATAQADVTTYLLCGVAGSGHRRAHLYQGTPALSSDGRYIVLVANDSTFVNSRTALIFDRAEVVAAADPLTVDPVFGWQIKTPQHDECDILQGVACDGAYVYTLSGYTNAFHWHVVQKYDLQGTLVREMPITTVREEVGLNGLLDHPTLGTPRLIEPEGITLRGSEVLVGMVDDWRGGADIVTFEGANYAYSNPVAPAAGVSPHQMRSWTRTSKAATLGAYNAATVYQSGTSFTRRRKSVWSVKQKTGAVGELPISPYVFSSTPGCYSDPNNSAECAYKLGSSYRITAFSEQQNRHLNSFELTPAGALYLSDSRVGSDNNKFGSMLVDFSGTNEVTAIRAKDNLPSSGAGLSLYGTGDALAPGQLRMTAVDPAGPTQRLLVFRGTTPAFYPGADNNTSLGIGTLRFSSVFAAELRPGVGTSGVIWKSGAGTPEGAVTAPVGSLYTRTDGGAATTLYIKETGTGNTGWVAK